VVQKCHRWNATTKARGLRRSDLTKLERAEQIAEWIQITDKLAQVAPVSKGSRGKAG
jgi:hypothetical protein